MTPAEHRSCRAQQRRAEPAAAVSVQASVAAMLACQQDNGALVASPDFGQYQYCWLRDSSFAAYALDRVRRARGLGPVPPLGQRGDRRHRRGRWTTPSTGARPGAADRPRTCCRRAGSTWTDRSRPTTGPTSRSTATGPGSGRCAST